MIFSQIPYCMKHLQWLPRLNENTVRRIFNELTLTKRTRWITFAIWYRVAVGVNDTQIKQSVEISVAHILLCIFFSMGCAHCVYRSWAVDQCQWTGDYLLEYVLPVFRVVSFSLWQHPHSHTHIPYNHFLWHFFLSCAYVIVSTYAWRIEIIILI